MSLRLTGRTAPRGNTVASIRKWAMIFMAMGVAGRCILENVLLHTYPDAMPVLTAALLCKVLETCATPLFAFLLVEGFQRTSNFEKYLIRVGLVAICAEIPYNLAMSGRLLDMSSRNPVFGMVIGLVMLFFIKRYQEKSLKNVLMKTLIFAAAFLWCVMLGIEHGTFIVIFTLFLWGVREKSNGRALYAFCGAMLCTLFSMYYIGACLSCIILHNYNEEQGDENRFFNYAFYPALLLILGIAAKCI